MIRATFRLGQEPGFSLRQPAACASSPFDMHAIVRMQLPSKPASWTRTTYTTTTNTQDSDLPDSTRPPAAYSARQPTRDVSALIPRRSTTACTLTTSPHHNPPLNSPATARPAGWRSPAASGRACLSSGAGLDTGHDTPATQPSQGWLQTYTYTTLTTTQHFLINEKKASTHFRLRASFNTR